MSVGLLLSFAAQFTLAQVTPELRDVPYIFKSEPGCPVDVISAKTTLEIDPVGVPMACRIYIDYTNVSNKALSGVRFRIGYIDAEDQVCGTFHAPDGSSLPPGGSGRGKWRGDKVHPKTKKVMIRGLMARFSDGSIWESEKSEGGLIKPAPQPGQEGAGKAFGGAQGSSPSFGQGAAPAFGGVGGGPGTVGPTPGLGDPPPLSGDPAPAAAPSATPNPDSTQKPATPPPAENFDSY